MANDDAYVLRDRDRILRFPRVIGSPEFAHFLMDLIPVILKCTETESVAWSLLRFQTNEEGHFLMCFEDQVGEVRAIHSTNPHWETQVEELLRAVMEEKEVANAFPRTDFENTAPTDSDHP